MMTRIVPSQVIEIIDKIFTRNIQGGGLGTANLGLDRIAQLQGIVSLIRQIPNELLAVDAAGFADLTIALSAIEVSYSRWLNLSQAMAVPPVGGQDTVVTIRRVLKDCPDEAPPAGTAELRFIVDPLTRASMRQDIGAANSAFQNAEWKAATVLGGAAIEALLHWKLSEPQTPASDLAAVSNKVVSSNRLQKEPHANLDHWRLVEFLAVARELNMIEEKTFRQAEMARDYRNLIHPGLAARQKLVCDRATALTVLSGLEHVIRDLSR
jgi:hypothetical protein